MPRGEEFTALRISRGPSAMNGRASSAFNGVVLSFKWQLLVSYGFILAAAGGLAFPFIRFATAADARSTKYFKEG